MKKKKTLSTQLTFVISFIVLLIVGVFWMANNTLLEKYYVYNKEKEMLAVYKMVDLAAKNDKLSFIKDDMLIVGCDIGSETHYIRAIDIRGRELSRKKTMIRKKC